MSSVCCDKLLYKNRYSTKIWQCRLYERYVLFGQVCGKIHKNGIQYRNLSAVVAVRLFISLYYFIYYSGSRFEFTKSALSIFNIIITIYFQFIIVIILLSYIVICIFSIIHFDKFKIYYFLNIWGYFAFYLFDLLIMLQNIIIWW